jgi:hypothetical protein
MYTKALYLTRSFLSFSASVSISMTPVCANSSAMYVACLWGSRGWQAHGRSLSQTE